MGAVLGLAPVPAPVLGGGGVGVGKGVTRVGVLDAKLMLLARPTLGHRSKRLVKLIKTAFELTTPLVNKQEFGLFLEVHVELAPAPTSLQLK